jgi:hypothetical protein
VNVDTCIVALTGWARNRLARRRWHVASTRTSPSRRILARSKHFWRIPPVCASKHNQI